MALSLSSPLSAYSTARQRHRLAVCHPFTNLFGPVTDALRGFPTSVVLDGEVIAINDKGQPDFEALQARLRPNELASIFQYAV
jgi:hypothetical protein